MKRTLLTTIALASVLSATAAFADPRVGTNYYGQNPDPYTHSGFIENTGFPPAGQSGPFVNGGFSSFSNMQMGPGCSFSSSATQTSSASSGRCASNDKAIAVLGVISLVKSVLNYRTASKTLDVAREGQQLDAGVKMALVQAYAAKQQAQTVVQQMQAMPASQTAGTPMVRRGMCNSPRGPVPCDLAYVPTYQAYPIPTR